MQGPPLNLDWTYGNRLELLENGEAFYPRAFAAIAGARREVLLETFILFDDPVGRQLQRALIDAARRGVEVHVLVDGWGSHQLGGRFVQELTEAGVQLRAYEPVRRRLLSRLRFFRRMHRKLLAVDGEVAFVGGINYSHDHLAEYGPKSMQDYAVRIEGPLAGQVRAFCRESLQQPQPSRREWLWRWRRALRRRGDDLPPHGEPVAAALVSRDNHAHRRDIERLYRLALRRARTRVVIANAYFFPGYGLLRDLRRAARRGVRVELILQGEPDMAIVHTAASMLHAHLIRAGVRVHEYCRRPFHGKLAVVDDVWATVGSSNLDPLSLALNLEANVVVHDAGFATTLTRHLDQLIERQCRQVRLPPATWWGSAWAQVRGFFVFHFLRSFPAWARWLPSRAPRVEQLQPETR